MNPFLSIHNKGQNMDNKNVKGMFQSSLAAFPLCVKRGGKKQDGKM